MKELFVKVLKICFLSAIIITLVCCIIDRIYISQTHNLLFEFLQIDGGEIGGGISAFGWGIETYYPLTADPINNPVTTTISFNIFAFLCGFILVLAGAIFIGLIVFIIISLVKKIKNKSNERNEQK